MASSGGTITDWREEGENIFFPRTLLDVDGAKKLRGGMHACFPNFGAVDQAYGLPQHGPLRNSYSEVKRGETQYDNTWRLESSGLLGAARERCAVTVRTEGRKGGFAYFLTARLWPSARQPVPIGMGLHPYFATPQGTATVSLSGRSTLEVSETLPIAVALPLTQTVTLSIPGIGRVEMSMAGEFVPGLRHRPATARLVLWRDRLDYLCVEPVLALGDAYGSPDCPALEPGKEMTIGCTFRLL